jgi:hypothetical protein
MRAVFGGALPPSLLEAERREPIRPGKMRTAHSEISLLTHLSIGIWRP